MDLDLGMIDTKKPILQILDKYILVYFETTDHDILLNKLKHYGFRGTTIIHDLKSF